MMETIVIQKGDNKYVECTSGAGNLIASERDALDLVAACGENGTHRLLIQAENLTPEFYQLKTGLAGAILLKFSNYFLKVAALLTPELVNQGRFREMVLEANRTSREFKVFYDHESAEKWLLRD